MPCRGHSLSFFRYVFLIVWLLPTLICADETSVPNMEPDSPVVGPVAGSLMIVGGGRMDPELTNRFVELAGGADASIVIIPTAGGAEKYNDDNTGVKLWKEAGAASVTVLHTYDRAVADSEDFVASLKSATAVWFGGGRQWRLADAYLNTRTHQELWKVLERGGVIGGSSAGATIQGSFLARGDTSGNEIMIGDHIAGLGFLKQVAIDQHLLKRNRQFDLLEIIEAHPDLLGIGIDESTAIVVQGDNFEVVGNSYVAIYNSQQRVTGGPGGAGGPFYLMSPGDRFDLKTRTPERKSRDWEPLERVITVEE